MRVPVYERQVGIAPIPGARVSAEGSAEAYGAGVGAAVHALGERAYQIAQDAEDAKTLSLFNAFRKESQAYHEDPDKGIYRTRILGGAQGVYQDADAWMEGKIAEYDRKMPSSRAARNFRRMADQYRTQRGDQNSRFEAEQMKQYREGEADAAIKLGLDDIAANYENDEAVEQIKQGMDAAVELRTRGMSPDAKRAAWAEIDNRIAMTRLSRMLETDPEKAAAWFGEHQKEFTADGLIRGEGAVNNALERLRAERERESRQVEAEQEKQGIYRAADAYWDRFGGADAAAREAIYGDAALTDEQKDRVWARIEARASDEERWVRQREMEWKNGWLDKIAESSSMEEALGFIEQSGASGQDRLSMERMAAQIHRPEKFTEDIRDWSQAFKEIKNGQLKSAEELLYRWGGRLSSGTIKNFTRMFYQGGGAGGTGGSGTGKKTEYVGWHLTKAIDTARGNMNIAEGSREDALFVTVLGDMFASFEEKNKRKPNPQEQIEIINELTKQQVLNGQSASMPGYVAYIARQRGYELKQGVNGEYGYFRQNGNGTWVKFDPQNAYDYRTPEKAPEETPPLEPLPARKAPAREDGQKRPQGQRPRMMPDGTPLFERPKRGAPASGGAGKKVSGRTSYEELRGTIDSIAAENGVEPALIRAIIKVESGWKTKAVSPVGAQGLMQLMPKTAAGLGVKDAFDADQNIQGGTKYISGLIKKYGDVETALAAYNAGPGRVNAVSAGKKKLPAETVRYVKNVMALYRKYQGETKKA